MQTATQRPRWIFVLVLLSLLPAMGGTLSARAEGVAETPQCSSVGEGADAASAFASNIPSWVAFGQSAGGLPAGLEQEFLEVVNVGLPMVHGLFPTVLEPARRRLHAAREDLQGILSAVSSGDPAAVEAARIAMYLAFGPGTSARASAGTISPDVSARLDPMLARLGTTPTGLLKDGPDAGADVGVSDVLFTACSAQSGTQRWWKVDVRLGDVYAQTFEPGRVNFGWEQGLKFGTDARHGIKLDLRWDARLGFGLATLDGGRTKSFFVDAGKTLSGRPDGLAVPEFTAEAVARLVPVPPASASSLSTRAGLGFLDAEITDGIPFRVSAVGSAAPVLHQCAAGLCGPGQPNGFVVEGTLADGSTKAWHVTHTGRESEASTLMLDLNKAMASAAIQSTTGCAVMAAISKALTNVVKPSLMDLCKQNPVAPGAECSKYPGLAVTNVTSPYADKGVRIRAAGLAIDACRKAAALTRGTTPFPDVSAMLNHFDASGANKLPRLEITARLDAIRGLRVYGGGEYGFREGEQDELNDLVLGFTPNQSSTGTAARQVLAAPRALPDGGVVDEAESFYVTVKDNASGEATAVLITLDQGRLRRVADADGLFDAARDVILAELDSKTPFPGQFDVERIDRNGRPGMQLVSIATGARSAPAMAVRGPGPTDRDRSSVTVRVDFDLPPDDGVPSSIDLDDLRTYPFDLMSSLVAAPEPRLSIWGEAKHRFHVDGKTGSAKTFEYRLAPSAGAPFPLGLPAIEFDLRGRQLLSYPWRTGDGTGNVELVLDNVTLDVEDTTFSVFRPVVDLTRAALGPTVGLVGAGPLAGDSILGKKLTGISSVVRSDVSLNSMLQTSGLSDEMAAFQAAAAMSPFDQLWKLVAHGVFDFGCLSVAQGSAFTGPTTPRTFPCELVTPSNAAAAAATTEFVRGKALVAPPTSGFRYNVLELETLRDLLTSRHTDLISYRLPKLSLAPEASYRYDWDLYPDFGFDVKGAFKIESGGAEAGYDTSGLAAIAAAVNERRTPSPELLANGYYVRGTSSSSSLLSVDGGFDGEGSLSQLLVFDGSGSVYMNSHVRVDSPRGVLRYGDMRARTAGLATPAKLYCLFPFRYASYNATTGSAVLYLVVSKDANDMGLKVEPLELGNLVNAGFRQC